MPVLSLAPTRIGVLPRALGSGLLTKSLNPEKAIMIVISITIVLMVDVLGSIRLQYAAPWSICDSRHHFIGKQAPAIISPEPQTHRLNE